MDVEIGDIVVGAMMVLFVLVGITMAAGATDNEIYVFGLSLTGFASVFFVGLIRRHFDRAGEGRTDG